MHVHREAIAKLGIFAGETREITRGDHMGEITRGRSLGTSLGRSLGMRGRTSEPQEEPWRYWESKRKCRPMQKCPKSKHNVGKIKRETRWQQKT